MKQIALVLAALVVVLPAAAGGPNYGNSYGPRFTDPRYTRPGVLGQALEHSYGIQQQHRDVQNHWNNERQLWQQRQEENARYLQQQNEQRLRQHQQQEMQRQQQEFAQRHGQAHSTPGIGYAPPAWSAQRHQQEMQEQYRIHQDNQAQLQRRGMQPLPSPYYAPPTRICSDGYRQFWC